MSTAPVIGREVAVTQGGGKGTGHGEPANPSGSPAREEQGQNVGPLTMRNSVECREGLGSLFDRDQSVVLLEGDARVIVGGMTPSLQNGGVPGESTKTRVHQGPPELTLQFTAQGGFHQILADAPHPSMVERTVQDRVSMIWSVRLANEPQAV